MMRLMRATILTPASTSSGFTLLNSSDGWAAEIQIQTAAPSDSSSTTGQVSSESELILADSAKNVKFYYFKTKINWSTNVMCTLLSILTIHLSLYTLHWSTNVMCTLLSILT